MPRKRMQLLAAGGVISGLALAGAAQAQETAPPAGPPTQRAGQPGAPGAVSDSELIAWLIVDNQAEIQISQLGQQQASNPEVQQFSRQMIQDHTRMVQALQRALGGPQAGGPGQPPEAAGRSPIPQEVLNRNPLLGLYAQLGQRVVDSTAQMLQNHRGPRFDLEYMQLQTALHMRQLDTLDLFSRQASPQLQQALQQSTQTVRQHLDNARNLLAQIESRANIGAALHGRVGQAAQPQRNSSGYNPPAARTWGSAPMQGQCGMHGGTVYGRTRYGGTTGPHYGTYSSGAYGYPTYHTSGGRCR